ncbi:MAG: Hsp20 family protein [Oceanospirillaceae bacterium]|nr:Hsp20 family protein [Oceanospirillaceae bacterium]
MRTLDLTPLYRSAIGFDRIASIIDNATRTEQPAFPPYNVELLSENEYRISMAVAGFSFSELQINSEQNSLTISGNKAEEKDSPHYLYQGIAARNFERHFQLADHMKVTKANMEDGLLHVYLVREIPEAMKSRSIKIEH